MIDFLEKFQILIRICIGVIILIAILCPPWRFFLLLISGVISGFNYGVSNDYVWQPDKQLKDKNWEVNNPKHRKNLYNAQQVWVHLICGITGFIALYILLSRMDHFYFFIRKMNVADLILTVISLLGYTGLLPSLLWFFAQKGNIKG